MMTSLSALTLAGALAAATPGSSSSGFTLGVDVGPNFVVSETPLNFDSAGIGVAARVGYQFGVPFIKLAPELKVGFESPGTPNAFRIMGGLRITVLEGFAPFAFAHLGGMAGDLQGVAWDVGGGIDFTIIPKVNVGAFVSYNQAGEGSLNLGNLDALGNLAWEWVQIGGNLTFVF